MIKRAEPAIGRLMYAAGESSADMLYATGLVTPDPMLWIDTGDRRMVLLSALEYARGKRQVRTGIEVLSYAEARNAWAMDATARNPADFVVACARHCGLRGWYVPHHFPLGLARILEQNGLTIAAKTGFFPERQYKNDTEVDALIEGVRLAEAGLEHALDILRRSRIGRDGLLVWKGVHLTSERLRGEIQALISRHDGTATHTIAAAGPQAADPHERGTGAIPAHVPVILDIFPRINRTGYHGDLTRTVVRGRASERVRKAFAAVAAAKDAATALVRPGAAAADIHRAAAETLEQHGFKTDIDAPAPSGFIHGTGHGLGLDIHEEPSVSARSDAVLAPGHVITIEPGVYYPDWGGVRLEDVLVVTEGGSRNLTLAGTVLELD